MAYKADTHLMQGELYLNGLKDVGATEKLVMSPNESFVGRAKESVAQLQREQQPWLETDVKKKAKPIKETEITKN